MVYVLNCIVCGYTFESGSADWCGCPMCDAKDIVVTGKRMSRSMFLLFSHVLLQQQRDEALKKCGVEQFIALPERLQNLWSNVPADYESIQDYLEPFKAFLKKEAQKGDIVLIQGDFGATYAMVNHARKSGLVAVYAATKRSVQEHEKNEKMVKKSIFEHRGFREYE